VIDSAAAGFQMIANGHPSCINPLMDLVARDPGLTAQMLIAANAAHPPKPGDNPIEDARLAVGQLGEVRLEAQARALLVVTSQVMNLPPGFDWPRYWTFQRGVARIAQLICQELEFYSLEPAARVAGQLHDIGRLILAHLRPAGFQAILEHARVHGLRLHEAERLFLGCTTNHLGACFGERAGLPARFVNVIRGMDDPGAAGADRHLVAVVSLARKLCRQNHVGASGDVPLASARPIKDTPQWAILSEGLYPSFNLEKFETQIHAHCGRLCTEFSGHQAGTVGELVAGAAS
jgi:HD-like signal output (HDOD) protein